MGDVYSAAGRTAKFFRYAWFNMLPFRVLTLSKMFFKRITAIKLITRMDILISYSTVKLLFRKIENSSSKILID